MREPISEVIVAELDRNARETLRVLLGSHKGTPTFAIWLFYRTAAGDLRPSQCGLVIGLHRLPSLAEAVSSALMTARDLGRLPW
jgi:hypothetical protein